MLKGLSSFERKLLMASLVIVIASGLLLRLNIAYPRILLQRPIHFAHWLGQQMGEEQSLRPIKRVKDIEHIFNFNDLYQVVDGVIVGRASAPREVPVEVKIAWQGSANESYILQLSDNADIANLRRHFTTSAPYLFLRRAYIGENDWRVSASHGVSHWSDVERFFVHAGFLPEAFQFSRQQYSLNLQSDSTRLEASWLGTRGYAAYLIEISDSLDFAKQIVLRESLPRLSRAFYRPGHYYMRVRGMTSNFELTQYSPVVKIEVLGPSSRSL